MVHSKTDSSLPNDLDKFSVSRSFKQHHSPVPGSKHVFAECLFPGFLTRMTPKKRKKKKKETRIHWAMLHFLQSIWCKPSPSPPLFDPKGMDAGLGFCGGETNAAEAARRQVPKKVGLEALIRWMDGRVAPRDETNRGVSAVQVNNTLEFWIITSCVAEHFVSFLTNTHSHAGNFSTAVIYPPYLLLTNFLCESTAFHFFSFSSRLIFRRWRFAGFFPIF
ncbi:hypothetical protein QBC35DRAFT_54540 [Podospora australis]|uniref:Uncharacterized protein n=1 Tax=Podospora australis TaxID=1536484 RepID=A0AAN6X009_9PEZI|nr:hypothetical protein QBC35DRAFT_54540 [Podospora australis]